ncbi:demethylmenaquinone methyltransferase/2-methoxy-6-polyprenyl-1,4-benzoquinol methylase [Kineococcus radiotolerans]|uniref:Demethylmenaquinone methyltransferase n=1 Tax=Kineococcus radiotolerans TaxID=131568 RepID=A0A7W4TKP9_KINRA|nr:demethylmenaquinone methyltransferase [Kineococcus radiotolerans]MBB2900699.1 demethylmenaquinone methyltransferase/2-methoxy-6-polyprenyl-1,4-benzoquinol methylase [Kineococcus radiotolerans]
MVTSDVTPQRELADLSKRPQQVSAMFDDVAEKYDRTNDILSAGQDRWWRRAVRRAVDARPGEKVLDLAAGTGRSSEPFADRGVLTVPCDFSTGMVRAGKRRRPDLGFVVGDATRLPFADGVFDAATISFGLRNVVDPDAGLREMARVVRPGGRLVVCEFSTLPNPLLRKAYETYLHHGLPRVAKLVSSHGDAYGYLVESIDAWPDQAGLAGRIAAAGWQRVAWRNLSFGVVAVHRAVRSPGPVPTPPEDVAPRP